MQLTKKEEEIMQVLWRLEKAFVKEIIEHLPEPKPHYNTVSTFIRLMVDKGIVAYEAFGKSHRYYPVLKEEQYKNKSIKNLVSGYFDNSVKGLVAHFAKEEKLSVEDLKDIIRMIENDES